MGKASDETGASPSPGAYALTLEAIRRALISDDGDVRGRFQKEFPTEIEALAHELYQTCGLLRQFTKSVSEDLRAAWVEQFLFAAFNCVLTSAHLLLSGLLIPSGNLMRQFCEACATALLASHGEIDMLGRLEDNPRRVRADQSIRDVGKPENVELLRVDPDGWDSFAEISRWYNSYSHTSVLAVASVNLFDRPNMLMVGSEFDGQKVDAYRQELRLRSSAAECLRDIITACGQHVRNAQCGGMDCDT